MHIYCTLNISDRDLIGIQPNTQRLTFMASTSDYDEELNLSYHLLHHYGNIVMHSRMVDSHIYVMKKWIIDFISQVRVSNHCNFIGVHHGLAI